MEAKELFDRIAICLVEPIQAGNIGSVARAMKNMGLRRLILVNPPAIDTPEARMMSAGAQAILKSATIVSSLKEAVAPFSIAVSTTARLGKNRQTTFTPRSFASYLVGQLPKNEAVICFGREDKGLCQRELDLSSRILTIPTDETYSSLNLAQSVMIVAYELWCAAAQPWEPEERELADSGQLERFFGQLQPILLECGFLDPKNPEWIMSSIRKVIHRGELDYREVKILRGICSELEWYLDHVAEGGKRDGIRSVDGCGGS